MDVAVVGAGFAGLALACRLAEHGLETAVIERRDELPASGAAITLQPNGLAALERLGLLERAEDAGARMRRVSIRDADDRESACWDYGEEAWPPSPAVPRGDRASLPALAARGAPGRAARRRPAAIRLRVRGTAARRGRAVSGVRHAGGELPRPAASWAPMASAPPCAPLSEFVPGPGGPTPSWSDSVRGPRSYASPTPSLYFGPGYANGVMRAAAGAYFWDHVDPAVRGPRWRPGTSQPGARSTWSACPAGARSQRASGPSTS